MGLGASVCFRYGADLTPRIEALGMRVLVAQTVMGGADDRARLAGEVIDFGRTLPRVRAERQMAVARVGGVEFGGRFAWLVWLVVHIAWLIGFRNRLVVLIDWAWAYLTFQRNARVVDDLAMPPSTLEGERAAPVRDAAPRERSTPSRERSS